MPPLTAAPPAATATRRDLAVFLTAKAVSDIGYALDFICLSVFVWERTRSAAATGLVSVALYAGAITGGRLGHRFGDRWDRLRVMVGADLVRLLALLTLTLLPGRQQGWWLYVAVFLVGTGRSVFEATLSAATPVLAGPATQTVNSVLAGLRGIAFMTGMGLATVAVPLLGYRGVFALDAASYGLSALVLLLLRPTLREAAATTGPDAERVPSWPLLAAAGLAPLVLLRALDAFGSSSQHVGLPMLGSELRPDAPTAVSGAVWSCWAAGLLIAGFVLRPLARRIVERSPRLVFCLATMVMSVGFIGVFWLSGWWPRLACAVLAGLGDALSEITFKQAMQRLPDARRGRAFGFSQITVNAGFMAGLLATSVVLQPDRVPEWVLLLHGVPFLLSAWTAATAGRAARLAEPAR
ncbi:MFS transporter [Kitasatospora sp. NPDC048540]|uniref:MFS transporter n=1 Tax=unclassified Kitasatospora TaxID=2633591 RepID=UPI000539FD87|nr:MFS transporter [Kitasatospora sp. MBT63]